MIKVSQLPAATAPLNGADLTLVVQGGVTSRSTVGTMFASQIIQNFTGTGAPWRVSAIQVSTGGTVYAKPVNKQ